MFGLFNKPADIPKTKTEALPGRPDPIPTATTHAVNGHALKEPYPEGMEMAMFGIGCFWGAERIFWQLPGVHVTAVGYTGGLTPNPTYEEVCTGRTGHNEVVRVVYDPSKIAFRKLIEVFWENHNPTQGMRQGNDVGTQYRSGVYFYNEDQRAIAEETGKAYGKALKNYKYPAITTEIIEAPAFFFAEDYHQQYLHKNPRGYCGLGGTGVKCG